MVASCLAFLGLRDVGSGSAAARHASLGSVARLAGFVALNALPLILSALLDGLLVAFV